MNYNGFKQKCRDEAKLRNFLKEESEIKKRFGTSDTRRLKNKLDKLNKELEKYE